MGSALAPVAAVTSSHKVCRSGVWGFTNDLSGAWQERNRDHVWEKRCSRLDLLGCFRDPGSGYAARGLRTRKSEVAYRSLQLRADVHAAPASSLELACPIAPPLCAPARVIPGRTLLEGEGRVGYRASPQLQSTPLFRWRWLSAVPIPVLLGSLSPVTGWCCSRRSTVQWRRTTHASGASIRGDPLKRRSIRWARAIMSSAMAMPKAEASTL